MRNYHKIPRFLDTNTNKTSEDIKQLKNYDNDTKTNQDKDTKKGENMVQIFLLREQELLFLVDCLPAVRQTFSPKP